MYWIAENINISYSNLYEFSFIRITLYEGVNSYYTVNIVRKKTWDWNFK